MALKQLNLNNLDNSRRTFARILRAFNKGDLAEPKFKALVYGLSHYLSYWREIKNNEIEQRLDELEVRINEHNKKD